jgi:hypothetical protein
LEELPELMVPTYRIVKFHNPLFENGHVPSLIVEKLTSIKAITTCANKINLVPFVNGKDPSLILEELPFN